MPLSSFFTYQSRHAWNVRASSWHPCALNWRRLMLLTPNGALSLGQIPPSWEKGRQMRCFWPGGRARSHWSGGSAPCSPCPPAAASPSLPAHPQSPSRSLMQSFPSGPGQPSLHPSASPGHGSALWNAGLLWLSRWWCSSAGGKGRRRGQQKRCGRGQEKWDVKLHRETLANRGMQRGMCPGILSTQDSEYGDSGYASLSTRKLCWNK